MRPCRRAACPRTFHARRHPRSAPSPATSPAAISSQAARTASHGRPRERRRRNAWPTPGSSLDGRTSGIGDEAVADQRGDEVEVARGERVIDGALDGVVRLVPGGGSPMEGGHQLGLADRELAPEEVAQERVVAIRPAVVVHQQGRAAQAAAGHRSTRVAPPRHRRAARTAARGSRCGSGTSISAVGAALEHLGPQVVVDEVIGAGVDRLGASLGRPGSERRERQQGRPPFGLVASGGPSFRPAAAARARVPARRPHARPSPARRDRSRAANPRPASGRTGGASVRVPRWPPATPRAGARPAPQGCRGTPVT